VLSDGESLQTGFSVAALVAAGASFVFQVMRVVFAGGRL
jgi:hypothetical protein